LFFNFGWGRLVVEEGIAERGGGDEKGCARQQIIEVF
jgi:hypothetical protein